MPTLFARRYARPLAAVSGTERAVGGVILLVLGGIVSAMVVHIARDRTPLFAVPPPAEPLAGSAEPAPISDTQSAFPDSGLDDWRAPQRVERFAPDDLYTKIDGRAEVYLQHHVVSLTFGTYCHAGDPTRMIDVYTYDMGTAGDARRVYELERPRDATLVPVGDAGYQTGGAVFFVKAATYVQVLPVGPGETDRPAAMHIAQLVAERIR